MPFPNNKSSKKPTIKREGDYDRLNAKDILAFMIAYFQIFWPFMLALAAVFILIFLFCRL
jgi:hypothetical protein